MALWGYMRGCACAIMAARVCALMTNTPALTKWPKTDTVA